MLPKQTYEIKITTNSNQEVAPLFELLEKCKIELFIKKGIFPFIPNEEVILSVEADPEIEGEFRAQIEQKIKGEN